MAVPVPAVLLLLATTKLVLATADLSTPNADYLGLTAGEKLSRLWDLCQQDQESGTWFSNLRNAGLLFERMCPTFRAPGDELPGSRKKFIHTVGAVGRVEWRSVGTHNYTGIFKGAISGLARLSLAREPDPSELKTIPGMAVKLLRDARDSANLVAMESVAGQESWNFFRHNFSTHIPKTKFSFLPIALKFASATKNIRQVGLSDWAQYGEDGLEVPDPVFPYRLRFQPTGQIRFPDAYTQPHTDLLTTIPKNSVLYRVHALDKPTELGGREQYIADLVLVSDMITSKWGDTRMFFRHQDMADDLRLRPEWNRHTPKFEWASTPSPVGRSECN